LAWLNVTQSKDFEALRHSNAWTNLTSTAYVTHSSETWLTKELQRLIEVSTPFTLAERFMLEERDIILREYEASVAENPYFEIEQNINKAIYPSSPWARSVLESPTEIEDFSLINAKKLHRKSHELGNAVLIVTGNISKTTLQKALRNLNFPKPAAPIAPTPLPTPEVGNERVAADIQVARLGSPTLFYRKLIKRPPARMRPFAIKQFEFYAQRSAHLYPAG
jgi:predicted Zn-dependent peptidase